MARIALSDVRVPLTDLLQKLSGEDGAAWLQELNGLLRRQPNGGHPITPGRFRAWKTIKLGTRDATDDLVRALTRKGFRISPCAAEIVKGVTPAQTETEVELVLVTVMDLGLTKASLHAVYDRAKELGLDLVPAEAGPQLRLQYTDQPMSERMLMAMIPVACSDDFPHMFRVAHGEDGQWLDTLYDLPQFEWNHTHDWVFSQRSGA